MAYRAKVEIDGELLDFGAEVKRLRKSKGFSQPQLAQALGVSPLAIIRWERQGVVPYAAKALLLAIRGLDAPEEPRFGKPGTPGPKKGRGR